MTPLLFMLLTAAPNAIACGYHEDRKTQARTWEVTDWSKQPRVFVAASGQPLYEKPDATSAVVGTLPFGAPVRIVSMVAELVEVGGRQDRWYRVGCEGKAGYVFGDALTSARFEDDFDGDKENELATVAFTAELKIRVRFWEPNEKKESFIDLSPAGGGYIGMTGGYAYPEALKKSQAGLPLVHVGTHVEACADLADYWVSDVGGVPRLALAQFGLVDPPNMATYKVEFQPAKKRVVVHRSKVEEEDKPPVETKSVWPLDGGVFVEPPEK